MSDFTSMSVSEAPRRSRVQQQGRSTRECSQSSFSLSIDSAIVHLWPEWAAGIPRFHGGLALRTTQRTRGGRRTLGL